MGSKYLQKIPDEVCFDTDPRIMKHYEHFIKRLEQRTNIQIPKPDEYWNQWVKYLRGDFIEINKNKDNNMVRFMGHYIKDDIIYMIVYTKLKLSKVYVPLTIFEIPDQKQKTKLYRLTKKNKHRNLEF